MDRRPRERVHRWRAEGCGARVGYRRAGRAGGALRLPGPLRVRPGQRGRHGRDQSVGPAHRRGPDGRRERGLLGRNRRALRVEPGGGEPGRRRHLAVYDPGHRRQNPHGLLQPGFHGLAGAQPRALRPGYRQRRGRGPPRHCHPGRGADEPEPLPGRGHRRIRRASNRVARTSTSSAASAAAWASSSPPRSPSSPSSLLSASATSLRATPSPLACTTPSASAPTSPA